MSKNPNVQKKIQNELEENHLLYNTPLTQDILDSLIYVECVTKEVVRCAPIASAIGRDATYDDIIDGIPIKKGDAIMISVPNLH